MSFSFTPKTSQNSDLPDKIFSAFTALSHYILIISVMLLPVFWLTPASIMLIPSKLFLILLAILVVVGVTSLAVLRRGSIGVTLFWPIIFWWCLVLVATLSALMSDNPRLSLLGGVMETQTVAFLALMGALMTSVLIFKGHKTKSLYLVLAVVFPIIALTILHLLRFIFGADLLTLGVLRLPSDTLVGGFNDLGILVAVSIAVIMASLVQLQVIRSVRILLLVTVLAMLLIMAAVNFFVLWIGLGLFSLALLLHVITKKTINNEQPSLVVITTIAVSAVVSLLFIVAGGSLGERVKNVTGVSYLEVRPSFSATIDILRQSLHESPVLGVGPNNFSDAWRLYKDESINRSNFWNTKFQSGYSYVSTWFVNIGILGILAWFLFLSSVAYVGVRTLIITQSNDAFWYYVATVSFITSFSIWLSTLIYVPGPVVLLLGALATGLLLVASSALSVKPLYEKVFQVKDRTRFVFTGGVMMTLISVVYIAYASSSQFTSVFAYSKVFSVPADDNQIENVIVEIARAYNEYPNPSYLSEILTLRLNQMSQVINLPEPTEVDKQRFEALAGSAIQIAGQLTQTNPNLPDGWILTGDVYTLLASVGIDGATTRAEEAYNNAKELDPLSPIPYLRTAILKSRTNAVPEAKKYIEEALAIKSNYIDAYSLLAQLNILENDVTAAIASTRSLLTFEPRNPALYYQLGTLQLSDKKFNEAIDAYNSAIILNPQFANARYMRALAYTQNGQRNEAIKDIEIVKELNPDNASLAIIIDKLKDESIPVGEIFGQASVAEPTTNTVENRGTVTSENVPDTDLVSPVNTPSSNTTGDEPVPDEEGNDSLEN